MYTEVSAINFSIWLVRDVNHRVIFRGTYLQCCNFMDDAAADAEVSEEPGPGYRYRNYPMQG